jgi:lipopolysaccharide/colanic/teichoic acid biosynthesis glycosyltransferase
MYAKFFKRFFDFVLSFIAISVLMPVYVVLAVVGAFVMKGNPFFCQMRPGRKGKDSKERIFRLVKFRTMSNAKDKDGKMLPDELRLNAYGKFLRSTSLDELPELFNILVGDSGIIGTTKKKLDFSRVVTVNSVLL